MTRYALGETVNIGNVMAQGEALRNARLIRQERERKIRDADEFRAIARQAQAPVLGPTVQEPATGETMRPPTGETRYDFDRHAELLEAAGRPLEANALRRAYRAEAADDHLRTLERNLRGYEYVSKTAPLVRDRETYDAWRSRLEAAGISNPGELPTEWNDRTRRLLGEISGTAGLQLERSLKSMQYLRDTSKLVGDQASLDAWRNDAERNGIGAPGALPSTWNEGTRALLGRFQGFAGRELKRITVRSGDTAEDRVYRDGQLIERGRPYDPTKKHRDLTPAQESDNAEIDEAREMLADMGLDRDEILRRTQESTSTGRENPDYDPFLAGVVRKATQRKVGSDPRHALVYRRYIGRGDQTEAPPSLTKPPQSMSDDELRAYLGGGKR